MCVLLCYEDNVNMKYEVKKVESGDMGLVSLSDLVHSIQLHMSTHFFILIETNLPYLLDMTSWLAHFSNDICSL